MKIALDSKRAYHNTRGLGNYSRDVIRLLTHYAPSNHYYLMGKPSARYSFAGTENIEPHGLCRHMPTLYRTIGQVGDLKGMDLYWGLSGELPLGIGRMKNLRKIVTMHDAIFVRFPNLYSATYRWVFGEKVRYACQMADTIIAISQQTKRDIIEFFGADEAKIRVVYQGCNNIFREPITNEAELRQYDLPGEYIVDVGAIEPRKNLAALIEAVRISGTGVPIVAVGGKSLYASEMAKMAEREGVKLKIMNDFPFRLLPALYKNALLSVYPSLFEGFGIPILEAMCVGTPVITSTGSCFAETGGDAALYADPSRPDEIAAQLTRALSDEELRHEMSKRGRLQAEKFTDERVAENIIKTLTE